MTDVDRNNILKQIETLGRIPAPPGCERKVLEYIEGELKEKASGIYYDKRGNLLAKLKRSSEKPSGKLFIALHADEPGVIATYHRTDGGLRVFGLGNIKPDNYLYREIVFEGGARGILVPDGGKEELSWNSVSVELGAENRQDAEKLVPAGKSGAFRSEAVILGNSVAGINIGGKALIAAVLEAVKRADVSADISIGFLVERELGGRGAKTASFELEPDEVVVIDTEEAKDTVKFQKGMVFKLADGRNIYSRKLTECFVRTAESCFAPYQKVVTEGGGAEAAELQFVKGGAACGGVGLPVLRQGTGAEMVSLADLESLCTWLKNYLEGQNDQAR